MGVSPATFSAFFLVLTSLASIESVIAAGKTRGASREDLYGCLYFFLSDTFTKFADRIRCFNVNFKVFCAEASDLAPRFKDVSTDSTSGPAPRHFDRIQLSYHIDPDTKPGHMSQDLERWAPLLKQGKHSCILADFQFWHTVQKGASVNTMLSEVTADILTKYVGEGKVRCYVFFHQADEANILL